VLEMALSDEMLLEHPTPASTSEFPSGPPRPTDFVVRSLLAALVLLGAPLLMVILGVQTLVVASAVVLGHQLGTASAQTGAVAASSAMAACAIAAGGVAARAGLLVARANRGQVKRCAWSFLGLVLALAVWASVIVSAGWVGFGSAD
jgi:hypothetical protein